MIVATLVDHQTPNAKELPELFEASDATDPLRHSEPVRDLIAGYVAPSVLPMRLSNEADAEASFGVYETKYPTTELDRSFLLIIRTRHIVTTVAAASDDMVSNAGYSDVPAYGRLHRTGSLLPGATSSLKASLDL
jgi:hypothetical protein